MNEDEWEVRRQDLCFQIDAAIMSINASAAALERLNTKRNLVNGSENIPWELEYESLLEGIVEALAYPGKAKFIDILDALEHKRPERP